jgi:hypothetical protein
MTLAPSEWACFATANPIPEPPPTTATVLFDNRIYTSHNLALTIGADGQIGLAAIILLTTLLNLRHRISQIASQQLPQPTKQSRITIELSRTS